MKLFKFTACLAQLVAHSIAAQHDVPKCECSSLEHQTHELENYAIYGVPDTNFRFDLSGVYKGVTTSELDELAAETAASLTATHPDYAVLAARIAVSNLHKNTLKSFSATMKLLYEHKNARTGIVPCVDLCVSVCLGCTDVWCKFGTAYALWLHWHVVERCSYSLKRVHSSL
jgi:hypothetical protein